MSSSFTQRELELIALAVDCMDRIGPEEFAEWSELRSKINVAKKQSCQQPQDAKDAHVFQIAYRSPVHGHLAVYWHPDYHWTHHSSAKIYCPSERLVTELPPNGQWQRFPASPEFMAKFEAEYAAANNLIGHRLEAGLERAAIAGQSADQTVDQPANLPRKDLPAQPKL